MGKPVDSPYGEAAWLYDWQIETLGLTDGRMYVKLLESMKARTVVELGCGTGRITAELADAGLSVTGVDVSPSMLKLARERVSSRPNVALVEADMQRYRPTFAPDAVIIPFSSFLCLPTRVAQVQTLRLAGSYLRNGGVCIVDIFEPNLNELVGKSQWRECFDRVHPGYGRIIKHERIELELNRRRFSVFSKYSIQGLPHDDVLVLQLLTGLELVEMMTDAGLTFVNRWGSYDLLVPGGQGKKNIVMSAKGVVHAQPQGNRDV